MMNVPEYDEYIKTQRKAFRGTERKQTEERAYSFDLKCIISKAIDEYEWTKEKTYCIQREYRRFLILCSLDEEIVPPVDIDKFWHLHILDTEKYEEDCEYIFGHFMHHSPDYSTEEDGKMEDDFKVTLALYRTTFKQEPPKNIWR